MIEIINLEGTPTGNKRISWRFAAERDRVASFNKTMAAAGKSYRTALWKGVV